jgi:hypothetical protein
MWTRWRRGSYSLPLRANDNDNASRGFTVTRSIVEDAALRFVRSVHKGVRARHNTLSPDIV